jgi:hypothetical protein
VSPNFISFEQAKQQLHDRLQATADEFAMWIFLGPELGGLAAYLYADEPGDPPRFRFSYQGGDFDYLSQLQRYYFCVADLNNFNPADRFLTYPQLVERWAYSIRCRRDDANADAGDKEDDEAKACIAARIGEGVRVGEVGEEVWERRLRDYHPLTGMTLASSPSNTGDTAFPPLEQALFAISQVEAIEQHDFWTQTKGLEVAARESVTSGDIIAAFLVTEKGNAEWWSTRMRAAKRFGLQSSRAAVGASSRPSRWYPDRVAGWLIDKGHMPTERVVSAMRAKFPNSSEAIELLSLG